MATREGNPRAPGPPYVPETPAWPEDPPANWLTFHLAHPGPGDAYPGDPNCAFDYKGRYHLHYIYRNHTGFVFAHVSSDDMVHWKWHPTVLAPPTTGHGMFSGTGFFTKEGKPAIIYHGQGSGRNWIQYPLDDQFNSWSEPEPVLPKTADGKVPNIRHWDPDCWLNGDTYYALSGGKNPQLMKSTDLKNWTYLGDLLHEDYPADLGVRQGRGHLLRQHVQDRRQVDAAVHQPRLGLPLLPGRLQGREVPARVPRDDELGRQPVLRAGVDADARRPPRDVGVAAQGAAGADRRAVRCRASWSCRPTASCASGRCANSNAAARARRLVRAHGQGDSEHRAGADPGRRARA